MNGLVILLMVLLCYVTGFRHSKRERIEEVAWHDLRAAHRNAQVQMKHVLPRLPCGPRAVADRRLQTAIRVAWVLDMIVFRWLFFCLLVSITVMSISLGTGDLKSSIACLLSASFFMALLFAMGKVERRLRVPVHKCAVVNSVLRQLRVVG